MESDRAFGGAIGVETPVGEYAERFFFSVRGERLLAGVVVLFGAVLEDI